MFCDHSSKDSGPNVGEIERLQSQFANAFLISFGFENDDKWNNFQMMISGKSLRLLRTNDIPSAMSLAMECYEAMKPNDKFKMQTQYFELEKERICSSGVSRAVTFEAFDRMQISQEDSQMIIEGFPSIAHIVSTSREVMEENSPVDGDVLNRIALFFGYETPTL
jgi:hypothetical protein